MQGTLTVIDARTGKTRVEATVQNAAFSLEQLQAAVHGFIEVVPGFDRYNGKPCIALCNEEGKLFPGATLNTIATDAWAYCLGYDPQDVLVGDVAIVQGDAELLAEF